MTSPVFRYIWIFAVLFKLVYQKDMRNTIGNIKNEGDLFMFKNTGDTDKNVMIINVADSQWLNAFKKTSINLHFNIVYGLIHEQTEGLFKIFFPTSNYERMSDMNISINTQNQIYINRENKFFLDSIDPQLLKDLSEKEPIIISMMYRVFPVMEFRSARTIYISLVKYYFNILTKLNVDVVIFNLFPHGYSDYLIYALSEHLKIKVIAFEGLSMDGGDKLLISDNAGRDRYAYLKNKYSENIKKYENNSDKSLLSISSFVEARINQILTSEDITPIYSQNFIKNYQKSHNIFNKPLIIKVGLGYRNTLLTFLLHIVNKEMKKDHIIYLYRSINQINKNIIQQVKFYSKSKKLLKDYIDNTDLDESILSCTKYVYFPLHYQPEASTLSLGDYFFNQELAIDILAHSVPKGWKILVKEHIGQIIDNSDDNRLRPEGYYTMLKRLDNVLLVPLNITSKKLIKNSICVATVTGTTGIEALVLGKPVITFGSAWYNECRGVFKVSCKNECIETINKIEKGIDISLDDFKIFLHTIDESSINAYGRSYLQSILNFKLSDEYVESEIIRGLSKWWKEHIES